VVALPKLSEGSMEKPFLVIEVSCAKLNLTRHNNNSKAMLFFIKVYFVFVRK
jgi:hypothetical protein